MVRQVCCHQILFLNTKFSLWDEKKIKNFYFNTEFDLNWVIGKDPLSEMKVIDRYLINKYYKYISQRPDRCLKQSYIYMQWYFCALILYSIINILIVFIDSVN